jgi:AcrR family transcriptional regulator
MRLCAKDRRAQLIQVAMRLFSLQGFDGTTTREIAQAARVNEAIIFRHFPSKEDLYWAVVSSHISTAGRKEKIRNLLASDLSPREVLAAIAENLLDRTEDDTALTRLLFFSALRNSALTDSFFRTYMSDTYDLLADYFRRGIKRDQFRKLDPQVAARGFMGTISSHILVQELFGGDRYLKYNARQLGRQMADLWLNGLTQATSNSNKDVNGRVRRKLTANSRNGKSTGKLNTRDLAQVS